MTKIMELTDADIATLKIKATDFQDDVLWASLQSAIRADRERIMRDLTDVATPAERLKFAQGELAQANRDIMLVERFLRALASEQQRRQRASERL